MRASFGALARLAVLVAAQGSGAEAAVVSAEPASAPAALTTVDSIQMVATTFGGGGGACGVAGPSAADGGAAVLLTGASGCDAVVAGWAASVADDAVAWTDAWTGAAPALAAANGRHGSAFVVAGADLRGSYAGHTAAYAYGGAAPLAVAPLDRGRTAAALFADAVRLYRGPAGGGTAVEVEAYATALAPALMDDARQMVFDAKASALYVVGTRRADAEVRVVARVDVVLGVGGGARVAWAADVDTPTGTPRLHLRRAPGAAATEVLLLSKSFYARVDATSGATLFLAEQAGLWLPEDDSARATYDPARDAIFSAAGAVLRRSAVADGATEWDVDFFHDPPPAWPAALADVAGAGPPDATAVHATADGRLHVVAAFDAGAVWAATFADAPDPTPAPTPRPTATPTPAPSPRPTAPPTVTCEDSSSWHTKKKPKKDCAWVQKKTKRCKKTDDAFVAAVDACYASCDNCGVVGATPAPSVSPTTPAPSVSHAPTPCDDDPAWFKNGEPSKGCAWVGGHGPRCAVVGADGADAYVGCCETCDALRPTPAPSPGPTRAPSPAPTLRPTVSKEPTLAPTTAAPTGAPTPMPDPWLDITGFARLGRDMTGGYGGPVVYVDDDDDLVDYLEADGPYVIVVDGSIKLPEGDVDVRSDKTILGKGADAEIRRGRLRIRAGVSNVIVQNIHFKDADEDSIEIEGGAYVWIDHCSFESGGDGLVDIKRGATHVTVSWCHFFDHHKGMLVGHDDDNREQDEVMTVTLHHNWMQMDIRGPRCRFARVHVYNNYYDTPCEEAVTSHMHCRVLVEGSFFHAVEQALRFNSSRSLPGYIVERDNVFVQVDADEIQTYGDAFEPRDLYDYDVDDALLVPGLVMANAGAGKKYTERWRDL